MSRDRSLPRLPLLAVTVVLPALAALPRPAIAQMGEGWVQYNPPSTIHLDGTNGIETSPGTSTNVRNEGASFKNEGGIETFELFNPISNRSERRMQNTYLSGKRQFEGEVRVSPPTNDESIMQVFGGNSGATTQMIRAYDVGGGTIRKVPGSVLLAEGIHGQWVKINVIHDIPANTVRTYVNGKLLATGDGEATNAGTDGWYHKYGCYGTLRTPSAKVEWRNVKHFRDGTAPPGQVVDAGGGGGDAGGSTDTGPSADASAPADATASETSSGTGGSTGTGGTTGGSGGATGSGGVTTPGTGGTSSGSGGRPATGRGGASGSPSTPQPTSGEEGCGCRIGAAAEGGSLAVTGLVVAGVLLSIRRRRRR